MPQYFSGASRTTPNTTFPVQCCPTGVFRQHCTGFWPVQCCLRQHWVGFFPARCYLEPLGQHCTGFLSVQYCPKSISWDNFAQEKLLEVQDNTVYEKNLFNVVLIILEQHCIGKNPVQCCPRGSQYCLIIWSSQCYLNTSRTTLHKKITCAMLAQSTQSSFHGKKVTFKMLSWSGLANIAQENYLYNVGPQSAKKFTQENNLWFCLDLFGPTLHRIVTYSMLVFSLKWLKWNL